MKKPGSFGEWLESVRTGSINTEPVGDGGYLVPKYMPVRLPGWRATFWRWLGRKLGRQDYIDRGVVYVDTAAHLRWLIDKAKVPQP